MPSRSPTHGAVTTSTGSVTGGVGATINVITARPLSRPGMQASAEDIQAFCRGQIAHYKIPRYVRFMEAFPMTVTGKIQKFMLREQISKVKPVVEELKLVVQ